MKAIELTGVSKTYLGRRRSRIEALNQLTLSVEPGEVFGFLGPNGAGKSTTIKILLGLISATSGSAKLMGVNAKSPDSRLRVGYLPENPAFYDFLTAREYLEFVGHTFRIPHDHMRQRIEEVLVRLELWDARNRAIRGYSKGMVQRLGLAQALLHDPDVLVLDEPMSGLDPLGRALVKEIMLDLRKQGKCIFFSTHIISDVEEVCDRVGVIVGGTLVSVEEVSALREEGIEGYAVRYKEYDDETDLYVSKGDFSRTMTELSARNVRILLVEPKRKNLEAYFLGLVGRKEC